MDFKPRPEGERTMNKIDEAEARKLLDGPTPRTEDPRGGDGWRIWRFADGQTLLYVAHPEHPGIGDWALVGKE